MRPILTMESIDKKKNIDELIILSKIGFSLNNLSQYFKTNIDEVIQVLAQAVNMPLKGMKRILLCHENELTLEEISDFCEVDIDFLKTFLPDGGLADEIKKKIRHCLDSSFSKEEIIAFLNGSTEVNEQLSKANKGNQPTILVENSEIELKPLQLSDEEIGEMPKKST